MITKLSVKNHIKNHILWIAVLVAVFTSACSSENEVTTPDNVDNPDTTTPTLTISTNSILKQNIPGEIIFYFSEDVNGFTTSDIILSAVEVEKGKFTTNDLRTYIWEITPKESGTLKVEVLANSLTDLFDNKNTASFSNNFTVEEEVTPDTTPPTLTISTNSILKENTPGVLTFTFDENVTGFTANNINLSDVEVEKGKFTTNSLKEYTWNIIPKESGTLKVVVPTNSFKYLTDNFNTKDIFTNFNVSVVRTTPPVGIPPALTNISIKTPLEQNVSGRIVFYFDEDVKEFIKDKIKLSGIEVDKRDFASVNQKEYYWEIIPRGNDNLIINVPVESFKDFDDNFNTEGVSTNFKVKADTIPPTLTIPNDPPLIKNTSGAIVFSFSEEVTNFTRDDIELSGVVLEEGEFIINSLSKYKLEVTPKKTGTLNIKIKDNSVQDFAGKPLSTFSTNLSVSLLGGKYSLEDVIDLGEIPSDRNILHEFAKDVFAHYSGSPKIVAKYVKKGGTGDGSSWDKATGSPKPTINSISGQSGSKIYLVLVASGDYPSDRIAMKNHVAIIGGWKATGGWDRSGETVFNGQNQNNVFNNSGINSTALLYGATIANGVAMSTFGVDGAGMKNVKASPTLMKVTFKNNTAGNPNSTTDGLGGGMYNNKSSPTLVDVSFLNNTAKLKGGGMYNDGRMVSGSTSPKLYNVVFSGNKSLTSHGGGMYSEGLSSPSLENVTFSGNVTEGESGLGGGMYIHQSYITLDKVSFLNNGSEGKGGGISSIASGLTLVNVTFSGNRAAKSGGGIYYLGGGFLKAVNLTFYGNSTDQQEGGGGIYLETTSKDIPYFIVNTIFWGNQANQEDNQVGFSSTTDKLNLHYSIIEGGFSTLSTRGAIISSRTTSGNPVLSPLVKDEGSFVRVFPLGAGSPAINAGIYVKKKDTTFYFSEDNTTWYTGFDNNGLKTITTPPNDAEDFATTDARGYKRVGRPDIGTYEYNGTP